MKAVYCPYCGGRTKRNGRTSSGSQRWRCTACGASTTVRYDDTATRLDEFLGWLLSKDSRAAGGPSGAGRPSSGRSVSFPDGYGEADLRSLAFIDACQDFVFHRKTGRGKTHLAIAVGAAAVRAGKSVRFFTVAQLVMHLADARDAAGCAGSSTTCCRRTCWYSTSSATCRSTSRGRGCCSRSCRPPRAARAS